jgi:hypothetical protein
MNRKLVSMMVVGLAALVVVPLATATKVRWIPYQGVISRVAGMVSNPEATGLASKHGLQILNVLWEDTGRWQGSSVGPNISDVTIEVADGTGSARRRALMPVIRFPNFRDKTADVRLDKFFLRIGNQREGGRLQVVSLRQFLKHPLRYLSLPEKGTIKGGTLLSERDTHALVSAQAAFLPVPRAGKATFYPVIFNYQSTAKNPAVLTILVTRQGTSLTVVDNARDSVTGGGSWGQRLFYNSGGRRAPLTAERLSDVQERGTTSNGESSASLGEDANLLMLIQVPLKHRAPRRWLMAMPATEAAGGAVKYKSAKSMDERARPDMEVAVLGHGEEEGPYTELDGLTIERDPRFPVRVTVQFYQATSDGRLDDANMTRLVRQISDVYEKGDYVGSLVVPAPSDRRRPTNWDGIGPAPKHVSWGDFPGLIERFKKYGILFPFIMGLR